MKQNANTRLLYTFLSLLLPVLTLSDCQGGPSNAHHSDSSTTTMTHALSVDEPAGDSTIRVHAEDAFDIRLRCAAGQGFSWQLTDASPSLVRQTGKETFEPLPDSQPGSDGIQIFHFKALQPGQTILRFIYIQPFLKPARKDPPQKVFHVFIQ